MMLYPWNDEKASDLQKSILCQAVIKREWNVKNILIPYQDIILRFLKQIDELMKRPQGSEAVETLVKKCDGEVIDGAKSIDLLREMDLYPWGNEKTSDKMGIALCAAVSELNNIFGADTYYIDDDSSHSEHAGGNTTYTEDYVVTTSGIVNHNEL